jgi:Tfp pilus assembly protein PilZ
MQDVASQFREYARLERQRSSGELSPAELARWMELKRALARRFSPDLPDGQADRRASLRVPTQMRVSFHSALELRGSLMTQLSKGGLFVRAQRLLDIGSRVTLNIHIEEDGEVLQVPAEVVSHNLGPRFESGAQGMGMRFLEMKPEVEREIAKLYDRALREQARTSER